MPFSTIDVMEGRNYEERVSANNIVHAVTTVQILGNQRHR